MKLKHHDGNRERRILTSMIVSDQVLARVSGKWDQPLLSGKWSNELAGWCVDHYRKYGSAPGKAITSYFEKWAADADKDAAASVEKFLSHLSEEYAARNWEANGEINPEQMADIAGEHFNYVKARKLRDALDAALDAGNTSQALELVRDFDAVNLGINAYESLFTDEEAVKSAWGEREKVLVQYPGALGEFFQDTLATDSFVAFLGPEKSGKSFSLMDLAVRAVLDRNKVAYFEVGDMSARQVKRRIMSRIARWPYRSGKGWPATFLIPTDIQAPESDDDEKRPVASVTHKKKVYDKPLDAVMSWQACQVLMRKKVKSTEDYFRLVCYPNSTVNVSQIRDELLAWQRRDGFQASVVVIDYADILAPPAGSHKMDFRHQVDLTWRQLRALSQELHCLVATATQAKREAYTKYTLDKSDVSEEKRKVAHVTALFGICVTDGEKKLGLRRYNMIAARELDFSDRRSCHMASALALSNPCVLSAW